MNIQFGDGTDLDTFETVFGGLTGYTVGFRTSRQTKITDATFDGVGIKNHAIGFKFTLEDKRKVFVPFDEIDKFEIY